MTGQVVDLALTTLDVAFTSLLKHSNPPPKEWRLGKLQGLLEVCGDGRHDLEAEQKDLPQQRRWSQHSQAPKPSTSAHLAQRNREAATRQSSRSCLEAASTLPLLPGIDIAIFHV